MTEVNHDPGPSTAQSAASTDSTDSGQAGGLLYYVMPRHRRGHPEDGAMLGVKGSLPMSQG